MYKLLDRGDKVLSFARHGRTMSDRVTGTVLNHWERLRAGRLAPMRSEIDPRSIEDALEHTFILERPAPDNVRIRLAGMHLCDLMGMEVRGMPPCAFLEPADRGAFNALLDRVFDRPEIVELELTSRPRARMPLTARMLILPMQNDLGEMTRALGCLVAEGVIGAPPRRFTIASQKITRVVCTGAPVEAAPGFAEPTAEFQNPGARGDRAAAGQRPRLRLVRNDE